MVLLGDAAREGAYMQLALKESFLTPSNSVRERYDTLIVSKARLIDYMLQFGVDDFFNRIVK